MDDVQGWGALPQAGKGFDHGIVDGASALASTENEQRRLASRRFQWNLKKSRTHRYAGDVAIGKVFAGFFKVNSGCGHPARDHAIGEAWHDVGLESNGRYAAQNCGGHGGAGSVSA